MFPFNFKFSIKNLIDLAKKVINSVPTQTLILTAILLLIFVFVADKIYPLIAIPCLAMIFVKLIHVESKLDEAVKELEAIRKTLEYDRKN